MNPCGKVFTAAELAFIADLLQKHDAYAVCDEVYEHLTFDGWRHIPLMTLPGLRERCMRVGSAGKTFSLTGWKIGYVSAPAALAGVIAKAHQNLTFTTPPNLQRAVAIGLAKDQTYFDGLASDLAAKRDLLADGLSRLGFGVLDSRGSYFVTADFSKLGFAGNDVAFCRHITEHAGVTAIPVSAFYESRAADPLCTLRVLQARGGARGGRGIGWSGLSTHASRDTIDASLIAVLNRGLAVADVAQLVERRFVVPVVAGSIPVVRPSISRISDGDAVEASPSIPPCFFVLAMPGHAADPIVAPPSDVVVGAIYPTNGSGLTDARHARRDRTRAIVNGAHERDADPDGSGRRSRSPRGRQAECRLRRRHR